MYIHYLLYGYSRAEQNPYGFKNLMKLGVREKIFEITAGRTVFNFSCKTSVFGAVFSLFEKKNQEVEIFILIPFFLKGYILKPDPLITHPPNHPLPPKPPHIPPTLWDNNNLNTI